MNRLQGIAMTLLVLAGPPWLAPERAVAGRFDASAIAWITATGGNDRGLAVNEMNRGDNPFNSARMVVFTRGEVDERTSLFLEVPIDLGATSSTFLSYFRPFIRVEELAGRPWLNAQAGKLPTMFGTYGERSNSATNGLSSVPLLFSSHTAVRRDVLPAGADELLASWRGTGGDPMSRQGRTSFNGLPPAYDACWDMGAEVYGASRGVEYSAAVTLGTPSSPVFSKDTNDGQGFAARLGYGVSTGSLAGFRAGVSGSAGPYLDSGITRDPGFPLDADVEDFWNTAVGADLAYARGPWRLFTEAGRVGYEVPGITPVLRLTGYYVEVERKLGPAWLLAARHEGLVFDEIAGETLEGTWDYDRRRTEVAVSWRFRTSARLRLSYQASRYPDAEALDGDLVALQLIAWTR